MRFFLLSWKYLYSVLEGLLPMSHRPSTNLEWSS